MGVVYKSVRLAAGMIALAALSQAAGFGGSTPTAFGLTGTFDDGSYFDPGSSITIDTTGFESITSWDILIDNAADTETYTFDAYYGGSLETETDTGADNVYAASFYDTTDNLPLVLFIDLGTSASFYGYNGGPLCGIQSGNCGQVEVEGQWAGLTSYGSSVSDPNLNEGSLAPEPTTLVLLLAGAAPLAIRRLLRHG